MNWIQERLNTVCQALQQPVVPRTPREGVLQYCDTCRPARDIAEGLLRKILGRIIISEVIAGQLDIMIRRRFIMFGYEPGTNVSKAYEREVRILSYDTRHFLLAIEIRNVASKQEHIRCDVTILDIDILYKKDPANLARPVKGS